jgi:hypothetical protein
LKKPSWKSRHERALDNLKAGVSRALAELRQPPESGEVRRALPLPELLDDRGAKAKWRVISEIKTREQSLYNRFGSERFLADAVVDLIRERECQVAWHDLVGDLEQFVDEGSAWLIVVPLSNAETEGYTEITDHVGLAQTLQDQDWDRDAESPVDLMTIFRHLDDHINVGARWHRPDTYTGPLDGRRSAALVMVTQGSEPLALNLARTRARYALALWCLLVPPDWRQLWPAIADWEPRPHIERGMPYKLFEPGAWAGQRSRVKGSHITHYQEYELPRKPEILTAPFEAMDLAATTNRLSARAALSAAWSLYLAERVPSDLERTDRLVHLAAAIDSLCDLGEGPTGDTATRWARLTERLGIWRELRGPYLQGEIEDAKKLARDLRNITAHGSDDTLVNLGYPPELIRTLPDNRHRQGEELALAQAAAAFPIVSTAVRLAALQIAQEGIESGWDDDVFRANFA